MVSWLAQELDRQSLPDKIADALRRALVSGALAPGTRLVESDLAQQLGVSRGVLREALRTLQLEGLVEVRPNRGTYVASISEKDIDEINSLRSLLEAYAAAKVASQSTPEMAEKLQAMVDGMLRAAEEGDSRRVVDLDFRLHKAIWEMSGHQRLYQILTSMESQIRMFLTVDTHLYERLVDFAADHQGIVDAIRSRDEAEAGRHMKGHVESAALGVQHYLRQKAAEPPRASTGT